LAYPPIPLDDLISELQNLFNQGPFNVLKYLKEKVSIVLQSDVALVLGILLFPELLNRIVSLELDNLVLYEAEIIPLC
jgi:hypothetical protein